MKNSKNKGNIGESSVIADLIKKGYDIAQPFGDNLPFDLVLIHPESYDLFKIQVKYSSKKNGMVKGRLVNQKTGAYEHRRSYKKKDFDILAIYCIDNNNVYYIDFESLQNKAEVSIRIDPSKNSQEVNVNWHEDYLQLPRRISPLSDTQ